MTTTDRTDYTALSDRMAALTALRLVIASIVVAWGVARPEILGLPLVAIIGGSVAYAALAVLAEVLRRRSTARAFMYLTAILLLDGLYLAWAMYATGGTQSPIRFLVYLHLVAVSLLASYRTGLKVALWDSLLLVVVLYAQAAQLVPPVDVVPGAAIEFERMPVLNVLSFWLFALATSVFSAMNERELRHRRADLQALVDIGARLDDVSDPVRQSQVVIDGLANHFGFERGVVVGASDDQMVVLATSGTMDPPTVARRPDAIVARAWDKRRILAVRQLEPALDPTLAELMPDARNVLVAPMIADGRPVGAVIVEHHVAVDPGHRPAGRLGRRPAVLDRRPEPAQRRPAPPRPGPGRARRADRRRQPPDVPAQPGAHPRDAPELAAGRDHRRPVHRPRRLQGRQRLHGSRRRGCVAAGRDRADLGVGADRRPRRPPGR